MYIIYNFINLPGSSLLATDKFIESVLQVFASNSSTTVWYASSGKLLSYFFFSVLLPHMGKHLSGSGSDAGWYTSGWKGYQHWLCL